MDERWLGLVEVVQPMYLIIRIENSSFLFNSTVD
jgi:hypothetical protein